MSGHVEVVVTTTQVKQVGTFIPELKKTLVKQRVMVLIHLYQLIKHNIIMVLKQTLKLSKISNLSGGCC